MRHAMHESEGHERILLDGIKIHFDKRNWVLLLPSKEHTLFHVFVEADSRSRADEMANEYETKVVQWRDNA